MLNAKEAFTEEVIDSAYTWPCKQRANFSPNMDIWNLRFHWATLRHELLQSLNNQSYSLMPLSVIGLRRHR